MPDGPVTLAFDTSAAHCAAALLSGERTLGEMREEMARGQAERLMPLLAELLQAAGAAWGDLDRIGVGIGPGNFTGIRISVAAARGLAMGRAITAIGVTSLEALSLDAAGPAVAGVDARGGQIYLSTGGDPVLAGLDALPPLPAGATCIGHEAGALARACGGRTAEPAWPLAVAIGRIAARRAPGGRPAPLYVRAPDAAPARPAPPVS